MALSIKNKVIEEKARRLARQTGTTITKALNHALDQSLLRQQNTVQATPSDLLWEKIQKIQREFAALPTRDNRSPDEIIGYNEFGHFD